VGYSIILSQKLEYVHRPTKKYFDVKKDLTVV